MPYVMQINGKVRNYFKTTGAQLSGMLKPKALHMST